MKRIKLTDLPENMTLRELAQVAHAFGYELGLEVGTEPLPEPPTMCKGLTSQGRRCSNKPSTGSRYCHCHASQGLNDE